MKVALRSALSSTIGLTHKLAGHRENGTRILTYHHVNDRKKDYLNMPVSAFRSQMEFLHEAGYRVVRLGDLIERGPREKTVILTFDDGFRDNYENAFPILREFSFPATIFCIADRMGSEGYLLRQDIEEMAGARIDFGSHTISHPHLPQLKTEDKLREIMNSRNELEEKIGILPEFFCYPYGEYDGESLFFVEEAGYLGACTNDPGTNDDLLPFSLKRTEIGGFDTLEDFRRKLTGAYDLLHKGLHWIRRRP